MIPAKKHHDEAQGQGALWQSQQPQLQEQGSLGLYEPAFAMHREQQQQPDRTPTPACATLTYAQLHHVSMKLAAGLLAYGAQPETTMVMLIPNGIEYTILLWTCTLLRITYVSLDPALLDISGFTQLKHTMRGLKPQIVVTPDATRGKSIDVIVDELGLPAPIRLCLDNNNNISSTNNSQSWNWKPLASMGEYAARYPPIDTAALLSAARRDRPSRIHSIMFTSGTSGRPKGCPMRVGGMSYVLQSQRWLITPESGAFALQQPHNSRGIAPAQTLQTWKAGGAVVMTGQAFSVADAAEAMRRFPITFLVLTPPMVHELAERPLPSSSSSVRTIQVGGDAVTRDVLAKCVHIFPRARVCINYGATEGGGAFVWPFMKTPPREIPCFGEMCPVGKLAPGARIRVWNKMAGRGARRGELGDLHVSVPSLIRGYLSGRSPESFFSDREGRRWYITGDVATVDASGLVFVLGRSGDMIRRAGVGVMPAVIESSVSSFLGTQCIVVAVPHHVMGFEPFAVISSHGDKTEAQIKDHVRAALGRDYALAGLASLKQLGLVEFPVNQTHKVVRSEVRSAVLKHLEWKKRSENGVAAAAT
jgi:4-coumarate--CoA ligase